MLLINKTSLKSFLWTKCRYGFGGTVLRDLVLGRPPSFVSSRDIHKYYIAALVLINLSPGDMIYKMMQTPMHPLRLTCQAVESIDAITTLCSSFEKAKVTCPNSPYAPYTLTLLTALGGSTFRYLDRRGRLRSSYDVKTEWSKPTGTIERAVALIIIYALARHLRGQRFARSFVVLMFMFLKLYVVSLHHDSRTSHTHNNNRYNELREYQGKSISKPFVRLFWTVQTQISKIAKNLKLGYYYH